MLGTPSIDAKTGIQPSESPNSSAQQQPPALYDAEQLRRIAWEVGERKPAERYHPPENHTALATVSPRQGFAHWRIQQSWIDEISRQRGDAWRNCRLILRLYDVTCIEFNGLNAHRIADIPLGNIAGETFFSLPSGWTCQVAEAGFLLRNNEFIASSRSMAVRFPPDGASGRGDQTALCVNEKLHIEKAGNLWEHQKFLADKRRPKLRKGLRVAALSFEAAALGHKTPCGTFVSELAAGQRALGQDVHVLVPRSESFQGKQIIGGVQYHPLDLNLALPPVERAFEFAQAVERCLQDLPPIDLFHVHEWQAGVAPCLGTKPNVLSLLSIETSRRNGAEATALSIEIEKAERECAKTADCILTPDWLREKAIAELACDGQRVHAFPMEGRVANEWEAPLDAGKVKMEIGLGPLDRLLIFIGPMEHGAGPDLIVEALPVMFQRAQNLRVVFVGSGPLKGDLQHRAESIGAAHAVRFLGDIGDPQLRRLLRASEALVLPSRHRVPFDDAVVDLARLAAKPVVTTHGGPAHQVRHEQTGIITYDNPGSMVWALDRITGDPQHAQRMGANGKRQADGVCGWDEIARRFLDLCAASFPELCS